MQRHTTSHLGNGYKISFSVGIGGLGGSGLHTTRSVAQILWGLCSMSRLICVIFVADLIACRGLINSKVLWHVDQ